ncbi:MAG TPA: LacI family DNA-binding transcriptional regulator [Devosia sp.]|nr:LacI family DNA-binding transcriptional regulator [Devosia sp.]
MNDTGRGDRRVRVEDVAREAGVSPITVSRVLRTPELVKPETRQRVLEAVAHTGYVVDSIASSLRSGRSQIITMFVANLRNPHFASAVQGAVEAFSGSRFRLMFAQTGYSDQLTPENLTALLPFRPAGMMFTGTIRSDATRAALRGLGVPVVEMWGDRADPVDMSVGTSGFAGGRLMGRHFAEQGFRRIAYCGYMRERGTARLDGFRAGLEESGAELALVHARQGNRDFVDGMAAFQEIMDAMPDCDAVFFATDLLAVGAIIAARRRGVDIPGQVALAGYGDLEFAAEVDPPITSVHVSDYEIGRLAGKMLLERLEGRGPAGAVVELPVHLVARLSTARKR